MAAITVTAARVRPVTIIHQETKPAAATITRGQVVTQDSSGKWALALATTAGNAGTIRGIALKDVIAGEPLSALRIGSIDIGDGMTAMAFNDTVFLSDTAGTLSTTAGTGSYILGYVQSAWAYTTADKLIWVNT